MAFPDDTLDVMVEIDLGDGWEDITEYAYLRDPITITRGTPDESAKADPAQFSVTLNNRDGRFSPRNPLGPYYGRIGRNTPMRISVPADGTYLAVPNTALGRAFCPDAPSLAVTDLDVRVEITSTKWLQGGELAGRYYTTGDDRSWVLIVLPGGIPQLVWSPDGTQASQIEATASAPVTSVRGRRIAVRATLDVNNGASGHTVTFYTGPGVDGPWVQHGASVVGAGVTSVFDGTAGVDIGNVNGFGGFGMPGRYHAVQVRNGIGGTLVVDADISAQTAGDTTFTDDTGHIWTLVGGATLGNRWYRIVGEVSAWPPRWDVSGNDEYVSVQGSGILRRLGQGAAQLRSAMTRALSARASYLHLLAFWPLEDAADARQAATPLPGQMPMRLIGEATFTGQPSGGVGGGVRFDDAAGRLIGNVTNCPNKWSVVVWFDIPGDMPADAASPVVQWTLPGSSAMRRWSLFIGSGAVGFPVLEVASEDGIATAALQCDVDYRGRGPFRVVVSADESGGDTAITMQADGPGFFDQVMVAGVTPTPIVQIGANSDIAAQDATFSGTISHLLVSSYGQEIDSLFDIVGVSAASNGYAGERAADRIKRLCNEESISIEIIGYPAESEQLGPQQQAKLLDLLGDAAAADGGRLTEQRDAVGLSYITRADAYNTTPDMSVDYGDLAPPLEPTPDDQRLRNDITIERANGSSARAVLESGPLSIQPPPNGVGIYDEAVTLNVQADTQLADQAGWRLHLGTWDEDRYPVVHLDLAAKPELITDAVTLDSRSHLRITGMPPGAAPGDVNLFAEGYEEQLHSYGWDISFNSNPQGPWRVGVVDDVVPGHLDTDGSQLASGVTAVATSLSVATTSGPLWTTSAPEFPFDMAIGGEIVKVTNVTGSASPQTFTVTRSINGVVKAHAVGTAVRLAEPMLVAL